MSRKFSRSEDGPRRCRLDSRKRTENARRRRRRRPLLFPFAFSFVAVSISISASVSVSLWDLRITAAAEAFASAPPADCLAAVRAKPTRFVRRGLIVAPLPSSRWLSSLSPSSSSHLSFSSRSWPRPKSMRSTAESFRTPDTSLHMALARSTDGGRGEDKYDDDDDIDIDDKDGDKNAIDRGRGRDQNVPAPSSPSPPPSSPFRALENEISNLHRRNKIRSEEASSLLSLVRSRRRRRDDIDDNENANDAAVRIWGEGIRAYARQSWRRSVSGLPPNRDPARTVLRWVKENGWMGTEMEDVVVEEEEKERMKEEEEDIGMSHPLPNGGANAPVTGTAIATGEAEEKKNEEVGREKDVMMPIPPKETMSAESTIGASDSVPIARRRGGEKSDGGGGGEIGEGAGASKRAPPLAVVEGDTSSNAPTLVVERKVADGITLMSIRRAVAGGAKKTGREEICESMSFQSVHELVRHLSDQGDIGHGELDEECLGSMIGSISSSDGGDDGSNDGDDGDADALAQQAVREYVAQKRNRATSKLKPIRNPGRYVLAIWRGLTMKERVGQSPSHGPIPNPSPAASSYSSLDDGNYPRGGYDARGGASSHSYLFSSSSSAAVDGAHVVSDPPSTGARSDDGNTVGTPTNLSQSNGAFASATIYGGVGVGSGTNDGRPAPGSVPEPARYNRRAEKSGSTDKDVPRPDATARLNTDTATPSVDLETAERCIALLRRLEEPVTTLRGVGPKTAEAMKRLGLTTIRSFLWHFPTSFVDRTRMVSDASLAMDGGDGSGEGGEVSASATLVVTVESVRRYPKTLRIDARDGAGNAVALVFFHGPSARGRRYAAAAERAAGSPGCRRVVSGRVRRSAGGGGGGGGERYEIHNPDVVRPAEDVADVIGIEPAYKLSRGLNNKKMIAAVDEAIRIGRELLENVPESLPEEVRSEMSWPTLADALVQAHRPTDSEALATFGVNSPARMRLAFEELCMQQAQLALTRWRHKNPTFFGGGGGGGRASPPPVANSASYPPPLSSWRDSPLVTSALAALPFELTDSQKGCLTDAWEDSVAAIRKDGTSSRMARLLQGDVGSGKTVVAYLLGLGCIESFRLGNVVAVLAPTTLLAQQHHKTFLAFVGELKKSGGLSSSRMKRIRVEFITGSVTGQRRENVLKRLECCREDEAVFLIGTHALLTLEVSSRLATLCAPDSAAAAPSCGGLALAVVDEEQRFGVRQREILARSAAHALYMSATPIPRSLVLGGSSSSVVRTGSLDISFLREKPEGARKTKTSIVDVKRVGEVVQGLARQISVGKKVFWILPRIGDGDGDGGKEGELDSESPSSDEESMRSQAQSVVSRYDSLSASLGEDRVGMVHGRMPVSEREEQLALFARQDSRLDVLVGTTVLEVGIDIPDVTILIVENAERFGLSQLHQLRGRIGRAGSTNTGGGECHCVLLTDVFDDESDKSTAASRLDVLRDCDDGAQVASNDLAIRGPGEILGLKQAGLRNGCTVDLAAHWGMITAASVYGRCFVENDAAHLKVEDFVDSQFDFGGRKEGARLLVSAAAAAASRCSPFFADAAAAGSPGGFALRACMCLFGNWIGSIDESNTGHSLLTLKQMSGQTRHSPLGDVAIESAFDSLARCLGEGQVDFKEFAVSVPNGATSNKTLIPCTDDVGLATYDPNEQVSIKDAMPNDASRDQLYLLVDVETTGLSSKSSYITQVAAKFLGDDEVFSRYVLPPVPLSPKIEDLTGITNDFLRLGGCDPLTGSNLEGPAPDFGQVYGQFCGFVKRKAGQRHVCLIAHNAAFDVRMLNAEVKRLAQSARMNRRKSMHIPNFTADTGIVSSLDTLSLFKTKRLWSSKSGLVLPPSFGLGDVYHHIFRQTMKNEHNAMGDVNALEEILLALSPNEWEYVAQDLKTPFLTLSE